MTSIVDIAPPRFRFLTAAQWGMTWKRPAVPEKLHDPYAVVHHTAGSRLGDDAVAAFQALNRWAQEGKDYSALDYDVLVHRARSTGLVTIGGGREEWMSAATKDFNESGEAVCVMGYFHPGHVLSEHPHPDEIEGVALAIVWGIERGWIARDAAVIGHHENPAHPGATGCPGAWFIPHLPTVRARVAFWLAALTQPPEELPMRYILKPPADRPGGPWFLRYDGTWSYLTGRDRDLARAEGLPEFDDIAERYDLVRQSVGV